MDSLTQIVLGAAMAEAALGKKIGNRAIVWGAIAGTLPDLDVIANAFLSPLDALSFHRGPTHSLLYITIASPILGGLVHRFYKQPWHQWVGIISWLILLLGIFVAVVFSGTFLMEKLFSALLVLVLAVWMLLRRYFRAAYDTPQASLREWQWLFWLAMFTHPILDCFTTYGTQIYLPFSEQRVAFNNIAVADPAYTLPFLACLIAAMSYGRQQAKRRRWLYRGIVYSCLYMMMTFFNKARVNTIFESSLVRENIAYSRYMTTPTILNNVLWSGIAETDSAYYYGQYSLLDAEKRFQLHRVSKTNDTLHQLLQTDPTLQRLAWFSDDYYFFKETGTDSLGFYDLRFGTFKMKRTDPEQYVFKFNLRKNQEGKYILKDQGDRPRDANFSEAFAALWERIKGV
jgi:inner membrane protein